MTITVYRNRVPALIEDFEKARQYYLSRGVDITFKFVDCNVKGYTSTITGGKWFLTGSEKLIQASGDMTMFVFDQAEWSSPKGSPFPLRFDTPTGNTFLYNGKPFINVGYYPSTQKLGLVFLEIIHEIMHGLVRLQWAKGNNISDVMDTYYKNNIDQYLDADSNFNKQWAILKPYMKPTVTITRTYTDKETLGIVEARNGSALFTCKSLELPWLNNQRSISCIPAGTYDVIWSFSPARLKYTYRIQNVPNRSGILIHTGNYAYKKSGKPDIEGCVLLGDAFKDINGDSVLDVINSTVTLNAFVGFMGKKPFTLIIK